MISYDILYDITICMIDVQIFGRNPREKNPQKSEISTVNQPWITLKSGFPSGFLALIGNLIVEMQIDPLLLSNLTTNLIGKSGKFRAGNPGEIRNFNRKSTGNQPKQSGIRAKIWTSTLQMVIS